MSFSIPSQDTVYHSLLSQNPDPFQIISKYYHIIISQDLLLKQNYSNIMEIACIQKVICSSTSKVYVFEKKHTLPAALALEWISGQKAVWTYAKKSIAAFKVRENQIMGCKVDLRHTQMYNFLGKWCRILSPRLRENTYHPRDLFFHTQAPFSLGIKNVLLFPELEGHYGLMDHVKGLCLNFVVNTKNQKESLLLLSAFQWPFSHKEK